ncbi:L-fuculose-phosphate aldolase [Companilactobacillus huachuanensis]|uniref:L-fuculose-phosphate aldolase n=1 Tax=Companilactobacillus huachuanensis TaxID=2559914 RepID=A0ABW1RQ80_9LACO
MLMEKEREQLIEYGKKLVETELTKGTGGNLSIYDRQNGQIAITPSGIDFNKIKKSDIVILDIDGNVIDGDTVPSSEWQMHLKEYQERTDIDAIIHAHTIYATVLSVLHTPLPASHYMIAVAGKDVRVAKYATYGSKELADNSFEAMKDRKAVFLANHGLLAGSYNIANAFNIIEEIEYCAKIYCIAKSIGTPIILPDEEMELMATKFENYGQVK